MDRALVRMRRADGRPPVLPRPTGAATVDTAVLDTTWVAAMTTFAQRIEERARASVVGGSGAVAATTEGRLLMAQGRFTEAVQVLRPVVEAQPEIVQAWDQLLRSYVALGEPTRAAEVVLRWSASGDPGAPSAAQASELRRAVERGGQRGYWSWRRDYLTSAQEEGLEVSLT
jgi:predicted Zn-dependent protease